MLTKYTDNIEYIYHYTPKDNVENILKEKVIHSNKDRKYKQNVAKTVIAASIATTLCLSVTTNVYADNIIGKTNVGYTQNVGNKAGWLDNAANYDTSWYLNSSLPYNIDTAKELAGLAYLVNRSGKDFNGETINITADIDLREYDWETIANTFSGTIDGTHKIMLAYGDGPLFADNNKGASLNVEIESNQQVDNDKVYINNVESYSTTVKEGEIVEKMSARVDMTIDAGVSYVYRWGTKDSAGNFKMLEGADNIEFFIPEELNEGSYTYYCQVSAVDMAGNTKKQVLSKPIQVTVTKGTRKVIFDAGEGEFDSKEKTVTKNIKDKKIDSLPTEPKHSNSNYRFAGWYTKTGEKIENPLSKEYESTTRLIAWYNRFIIVEFDTKGGIYPDGSDKYVLEYEEDSIKTIKDFPKDPMKKGYKFLGWYYVIGDKERKVATYDGETVIYPEDADEITIYAKWEKIKENKDNEDSAQKVEENKQNKEGAQKLENVPKTSDKYNVRRWSILIGLSGCISLVMLVYKKVRERIIYIK